MFSKFELFSKLELFSNIDWLRHWSSHLRGQQSGSRFVLGLHSKRRSRMNLGRPQQGYTLLELLVASLISLFLIIGAMGYFVSSAQSFRLQVDNSSTQDNARFALDLLAQNVRKAGLHEPSATEVGIGRGAMSAIVLDPICQATAIAGGGTAQCTDDAVNNSNAALPNSDRLAIDFFSGTTALTSCSGATNVPALSRGFSVFWVADNDGDGVNSLYCQTHFRDAVGALQTGTAIPLVDGIDYLQFLYGVDTDDDGVVNIQQNITDFVASGLDTATIKLVKIALLAVSGNQEAGFQTLEDNVARSYTLLDGANYDVTDRVSRKIYSTLVYLKNSDNQ